jgi:hypothetical protein
MRVEACHPVTQRLPLHTAAASSREAPSSTRNRPAAAHLRHVLDTARAQVDMVIATPTGQPNRGLVSSPRF